MSEVKLAATDDAGIAHDFRIWVYIWILLLLYVFGEGYHVR